VDQSEDRGRSAIPKANVSTVAKTGDSWKCRSVANIAEQV
jgi:hypothetical protein